MDAAELITHCRISAGLSRRQLAESIGVFEQTVWNWETRKCCPRSDSLLAVLRVTGFDFCIRKKKTRYSN